MVLIIYCVRFVALGATNRTPLDVKYSSAEGKKTPAASDMQRLAKDQV
jgi:hypothetical protein